MGREETHAWERPLLYIADDNEGNVGIIEFGTDMTVGAISCKPRRALDWVRAIDAAPQALRSALAGVCELPLLKGEPEISVVFWSEGEFLRSHEPWHETYRFAGELIERELLPNAAWESEAAHHYSLPQDIVRLVLEISARAEIRVPLLDLSAEEIRQLIPTGSRYAQEALELLISDGLFRVTSTR